MSKFKNQTGRIKKRQLLRSLFKRNQQIPLDQLPRLNAEPFEIFPTQYDLARFNQLVDWSDPGVLSPTWLQAVALPDYLNLMTDETFPFSPLGFVHVNNELRISNVLPVHERYLISCDIAEYHEHRKGILIAARVTARIDNEIVYEAIGSFLAVIDALKKQNSAMPGNHENQVLENTAAETWLLHADVGKRYARLTGDYNLIHFNPFFAKMLGFKRHIAHGMFLKAKALSRLSAMGFANGTKFPLNMSMAFKKPVFLPGEVTLGIAESDACIGFDLRHQDILHATGSITR